MMAGSQPPEGRKTIAGLPRHVFWYVVPRSIVTGAAAGAIVSLVVCLLLSSCDAKGVEQEGDGASGNGSVKVIVQCDVTAGSGGYHTAPARRQGLSPWLGQVDHLLSVKEIFRTMGSMAALLQAVTSHCAITEGQGAKHALPG